MLRASLAAACALLPAIAGCASRPSASSVELDRRFRIEAGVDDSISGTFLFDTGFTLTTVGEAAAGRWKLAAGTGPVLEGVDATGVPVPLNRYVRLKSLRIGEVCFTEFPASLIAIPDAMGVDGVIGSNVMEPLAWILDAPAGRLTVLSSADLEAHLREHYAGAEWTVVPLRRTGGAWFVDVELEGGRAGSEPMMLDTGAGGSRLPSAVIVRLLLPDGMAERRRRDNEEAERRRRALEASGMEVEGFTLESDGEMGVAGETRHTACFRLAALRLGGVRVEDLLVTEVGDRPGLLGADVLSRIVWVLDGPGSRMLVKND